MAIERVSGEQQTSEAVADVAQRALSSERDVR